MKKINYAVLLAAIALAGACGKTKDGDLTVERPVDVKTTTDTIAMPNAPDVDVGMKKDTIVVSRPTVTVTPDGKGKKP